MEGLLEQPLELGGDCKHSGLSELFSEFHGSSKVSKWEKEPREEVEQEMMQEDCIYLPPSQMPFRQLSTGGSCLQSLANHLETAVTGTLNLFFPLCTFSTLS